MNEVFMYPRYYSISKFKRKSLSAVGVRMKSVSVAIIDKRSIVKNPMVP